MRHPLAARRLSRLVVGLFALLMSVAAPSLAQTSLCCPADLDGDGAVGPADLALVLDGWGSPQGDVDGDGATGPADLALLLGAWGTCATEPCLLTRVVGRVVFDDGAPAASAVIVTNQGGKGVSGPDGAFSFDVEVEKETSELQVTAIASVRGVTYAGTALASPIVLGGVTDAGEIVVVADAACEPRWLPTFGGQPGVDGDFHPVGIAPPPVSALHGFDDGSERGPVLIIGGSFTSAGGTNASRIASFDGETWSALGAGVNNTVLALATFDDGSGPALYAAGTFTTAGGLPANRIARWDGSSWSTLGSGMNATVRALLSFDDGSGGGAMLYAAGDFTTAGGVPANRIARWNGSEWSPLADGVNGVVRALALFDDGQGDGPALYAGGEFTEADGVPVGRIARWNGTTWSSLGTGVDKGVHALTTFDDGSGSGPALYAGGDFSIAGSVAALRIARWDGSGWSALGIGVYNPAVYDSVWSLTTFDDGSGNGSGGGQALYVGGQFVFAGGAPAQRIARWDGSDWSPVGEGVNLWVCAMTSFDDRSGGGPALYAGGWFTVAGESVAKRIARWDGSAWSALDDGLSGVVLALTTFDDGAGDGPALFVGGGFTRVGGLIVNGIAKWDGRNWSALGSALRSGVDGQVSALVTFDDGSGAGPALYAGGFFTVAGGVEAKRIARWDGASWSPVGEGFNDGVTCLLAVDADAPGGPSLYAAGWFSSEGGAPANRVARWDGTAWSALGSGLGGDVVALAVFDDGWADGRADGGARAPTLYAGGSFTISGSGSVFRIARWDGALWTPLPSSVNGHVSALVVFDDGSGSGPALIAGGSFTNAGGTAAQRIARWDGTSWSPLGAGVNGAVRALLVDGRRGENASLLVAGAFSQAGGAPTGTIARWDGQAWSPLGTTLFTEICAAIERFDDPDNDGYALYAGGVFPTSPAGDSFLAKWGCAPTRP